MRAETEELRELLMDVIKRKIALRAYELFQERGGTDGRDLEDWLQAENEVHGQSILAPLYTRANKAPGRAPWQVADRSGPSATGHSA